MAGRLDGKVAVITGGTSGIGEATVELFAAQGAKVVIVGRNEAQGAAMVAKLGPATRFFRADATREAEIKAAIDFARDNFGRLDILFNNAGGGTKGSVDTFTAEDLDSAKSAAGERALRHETRRADHEGAGLGRHHQQLVGCGAAHPH